MSKFTEAQHQRFILKWSRQASVRTKWPELALLYHIPNGGSRDEIEGKHLKQQGVKAGVPDLCLPAPRGQYHGLYIEMKKPGGEASPEQAYWIEALNGQGYFAKVCHGWEVARHAIEWYLSLPAQKSR